MHQYVNQKHHDVKILVGAHAWFLMDHLYLHANLSGKLALKFISSYHIVVVIDPIAFCLELMPGSGRFMMFSM